MRLILTGAEGFVAPYVIAEVRKAFGNNVEILPTSYDGTLAADGTHTKALDITDAEKVAETVKSFAPTHFLHLAGISTLSFSAINPDNTWIINVFGTLNCLRALIAHAQGSVFIFAGTAIAYGESARTNSPLTETDLLQPNNEYGVTKAAADLAIGAMSNQGVTVLRMRPFNHTGPDQAPNFVIPSFANQIARIEKGLQSPVIYVGNLDVARDFLDVRDVARCYVMAMQRAPFLHSGSIFNIASQRALTIRSLLEILLAQSEVKITIETDPERVRTNEIPLFSGKAIRAETQLGWQPAHKIEDTVIEILHAYRKKLG